MKTYTITVNAEEAKELGLDGQIIVCNDCREFAHTEETVVHHKTCKDGDCNREIKRQEEFTEEERNFDVKEYNGDENDK